MLVSIFFCLFLGHLPFFHFSSDFCHFLALLVCLPALILSTFRLTFFCAIGAPPCYSQSKARRDVGTAPLLLDCSLVLFGGFPSLVLSFLRRAPPFAFIDFLRHPLPRAAAAVSPVLLSMQRAWVPFFKHLCVSSPFFSQHVSLCCLCPRLQLFPSIAP